MSPLARSQGHDPSASLQMTPPLELRRNARKLVLDLLRSARQGCSRHVLPRYYAFPLLCNGMHSMSFKPLCIAIASICRMTRTFSFLNEFASPNGSDIRMWSLQNLTMAFMIYPFLNDLPSVEESDMSCRDWPDWRDLVRLAKSRHDGHFHVTLLDSYKTGGAW